MITLDGARALGWRLARHGLDPVTGLGVVDVAGRVLAARAWPAEGAELMVAQRQASPSLGAVAAELAAGTLVCAYAFRGGSYLMSPEVASTVLAVRTTTRVWESPRYQAQGGFEVHDWGSLQAAVREVLTEGPATRAEIAAHLATSPALRHLAEAAASGAGSDSLYKPLHWWGDICFGPSRDGQSTFRLASEEPGSMNPDVDTAGRRAVADYLGAYGPATFDNLTYWLTEGLSAPRRRVLGWLEDLGGEVTRAASDGVDAYVLTESLDAIQGSEPPSDAVVLLPAYDPWVMGPGTSDARLVPPARRALLSNGGNAVVHRGVVRGTWKVSAGAVRVAWFDDSALGAELAAAVERLAAIRGEELVTGDPG